jgi:hypothetical protein
MKSKTQMINELKAQYRVLSEVESRFPRKSKHKAAVFVDKKITEILTLLAALKNKD